MELWVRSQDKMKLVKVNYCYIMDQQDHFTIIGETIDSGPIVGIYKTKERALEVLDEIQNILLKSKYDKASENYGKHSDYKDTLIEISSSNYVYEMPED